MIYDDRDFIWRGRDADDTESRSARDRWEQHVAKRKEIASALALTIRIMQSPTTIDLDRQRPDEAQRYFRWLTGPADELLTVSVKHVRQQTGEWIKFFQSAWFERQR